MGESAHGVMGMLERRREPSAPAAGVALPMLLRGCCWDEEDASGLVDLVGLEEGLSRTRRRNWSLFIVGCDAMRCEGRRFLETGYGSRKGYKKRERY